MAVKRASLPKTRQVLPIKVLRVMPSPRSWHEQQPAHPQKRHPSRHRGTGMHPHLHWGTGMHPHLHWGTGMHAHPAPAIPAQAQAPAPRCRHRHWHRNR
jgi:hypothetical protein